MPIIGGITLIIQPTTIDVNTRSAAGAATPPEVAPRRGYPEADVRAPNAPKGVIVRREVEKVSFAGAPRVAGATAQLATMHGVPDGFMATNPSRLVELGDGRVAMAVREQQDPAFLKPGVPPPGPSQVGLYVRGVDGAFTRSRDLFVGTTDWYEDPALVRLNGQLYVSTVHVEFVEKDGKHELEDYTTRLHTMRDDGEVGPCIASGPSRMKDIRLVELADGGIGLLTRPKGTLEGVPYNNGYIGFIRLERPEDLSPSVALAAKAIFQPNDVIKAIRALGGFNGDVWVGGNDAHPNADGGLTVYAHFGTQGPYGAIRFDIDPDRGRGTIRNVALIALAEDFAGLGDGPVRPDTVFTGGFSDGVLTCGLNDYKLGLVSLPSR